ncbi:Cytochrome P450 [Mycena sanguinolenta]|uniref:Cytochrome P450 n=1 Tax=Mycena sanguinolenta TaxID=230812 RepID=A0A8H6ZAP2_9AGAR|nr:Cytochrome P450 [Mycena sanguinolenta]
MFTLLCGMDYGTTLQGVAFIFAIAIYLVFRGRSTIHYIPGPPSPSWTFGHMLQLLLPPQYGDLEFKWQKLYGPVYRVKGCFGQDRLMISDPLALHHVLNSSHFDHGPSIANAVSLLFEEKCVMAAHGETHKRLRAAMQVGFTASAVRGCLPLFERIAQAVAARLEELPGLSANIMPVLSEATLNAMSQGRLSIKPHITLSDLLSATLSASTQDLGQDFVLNNTQILQVTFALSDLILLSWSLFRILGSSQSTVQILADAVAVRLPKWVWRAATHLPTKTFKVIRTAKCFAKDIGERAVWGKMEAGLPGQTDVFDKLLDLGRRERKKNALTQEEVAAQTGVLFIAGQDNTASLLAFGLLELARHPQFQQELRDEIHHFLGSRSDGFMYDNMPLLNAFIKETLRLYPAGALQERMATQDTVIPLTGVTETTTGKLINQTLVRKGQIVYMAIASYHRLETLWGKDAHEFRPSRWLDGTAYQGHALGPYANLFVNPHFQGHTLTT